MNSNVIWTGYSRSTFNRTERQRLKSFTDWRFTHQGAKELAAAGFCYTGIIDKVECYECGTEICRWDAKDVPIHEHEKWSGRCNFIRFITMVKCAHPNQERYISRLATIEKSWRWNFKFGKQTQESLADAGFFCKDNNKDYFTCYCCGGRLKNIALLLEDPWYQHAKYHPECMYVQLIKGVDYVKNIQRAMKEATQAEMDKIAVEVITPDICILLPRVNELGVVVKRPAKELSLVKSLEGVSLCKVCLDKNVEIVFLPCRHLATCKSCAAEVTTCVICRININVKFRVFLS